MKPLPKDLGLSKSLYQRTVKHPLYLYETMRLWVKLENRIAFLGGQIRAQVDAAVVRKDGP